MANFLKSLFVKGVEIDTSSATTNQVLKFDGTKFLPGTVSGGGSSVTVSDTPPTSPTAGDLWYESDSGKTFVYYDSFWVEISSPTGSTVNGGALGYYGVFQDNNNQTAANTTTAYAVVIGQTDESNGVSVVSDGSSLTRITFANAGVYNIQFSIQFVNSDSAEQDFNIWFRKNGTDMTATNSQYTVAKSRGPNANGKLIAALNYMLTLAAGDYIQIMWQPESTNLYIASLAAGTTPTTPTTPSVIVTAQQVMNTQVGTAAASAITGTTLASNVTGSSLTSVGTLTSLRNSGSTNLGSNTWTKTTLDPGELALDNGTTDTPGLLLYTANNKNWGIDSYNNGSSQVLRFVRDLNESGGTTKASLDTNGNFNTSGYLDPNAWKPGQVIKDTMLSNTEMTVVSTTIATSGSNTDFITYSYTPVSSSSYLFIHFHCSKYAPAGTTDDSWYSVLKAAGNEIAYGWQKVNDDGTGTSGRSGVLFPLTGRYTNSSTSAVTIAVAARRDTADDSIAIDNSATALWLRITEVAR